MSLNLDGLRWSIAEGKTDGYTFQNRFRHFPKNFDTTKYPQRLNIFWTMGEIFENGFPTENELEKLHNFENRLVFAVEEDEFSILSMVLTGNGQCEFVFHTPDPQEFIERLTNMPQEKKSYPIEIHCNEDEYWVYYFDEINGYKGA